MSPMTRVKKDEVRLQIADYLFSTGCPSRSGTLVGSTLIYDVPHSVYF